MIQVQISTDSINP